MKKIRAAFPRAETDLNGRKRAFFDNGTGTLVVGRAARAEMEARVNCSANVGGHFDESKKANTVILEGRQAIADLLNAPTPDTIVSGESATALFFNLSYAIGKELTGKENVVTTDYEHYANISPWVELEKRRKIEQVRFTWLNKEEGTLDMDHLQGLIDAKTKVVTVTAASNVLGTKSPLTEIGKMAKEVNAYFVVDAVHHIAHGPIDVEALGCDFLVFSGYKLFSSHGSFLYGRKDLLESLNPYKVASAPEHIPDKWEWGTRNQAMFAAIRNVIDHLLWLANHVQAHYEDSFTEYTANKRSLKVSMDAVEKYERKLMKAVLVGHDDIRGLKDIPRVQVFGLTDQSRLTERDPTFAFKVENIPDDEIVGRLWTDGSIATRADDYYSRAQDIYNLPTVVRISLVHYNTLEEIDVFLKTLNAICESK
ncbi:MAG: aminotransferase class V-fold PLP-dependent enzyme [Candidatus Heimdallarchaeota archaeon]